MCKLSFVMGEGESERYFLPSMLRDCCGFDSVPDKNNCIFQKNDTFWLIPFPPGSKNGGKDKLFKKDTFKTAASILSTYQYHFGSSAEIHLIVLIDTDGGDASNLAKKKGKIESAIAGVKFNHHHLHIYFVDRMIESWFLAGLTNKYPYFDRRRKKEIDNIISLPNVDVEVKRPKQKFYSLIEPGMQNQLIKIASTAGSNFNIPKARQHSPSFNSFFTGISTANLL